MFPEIIRVNKSLETRLDDYLCLLDEAETPCSEIREVWSAIFDITLTKCGWKAVWMLSEQDCRKYEVLHPSIVLVTVDSYNYKELTTGVSVVGVQEDILLPPDLDVSLTELHPLRQQAMGVADLQLIADWLDRARFFFKHLWFPWDSNADMMLSEWCALHLRNRLQLHYDMKEVGGMEAGVGAYIQSLLRETHAAEEELNAVSAAKETTEQDRLRMVQNHLRRKRLKAELQLFEEPDLRSTMAMWTRNQRGTPALAGATLHVAWTGGSLAQLTTCLDTCQRHVAQGEGQRVHVYNSLDQALQECFAGDTVMLAQGEHRIKALGSVQNGGVLIGVPDDGNVMQVRVIADEASPKKAVLLELFAPVTMENLSIRREEGVIFQVFSGTLILKNCLLEGGESSTSRGIVVLPGCRVELHKCQLRGLGSALCLQGDATAVLSDCIITQCHEGIRLTDESRLTTTGVQICNNKGYGLHMETRRGEADDAEVGGGNLLIEELGANVTVNNITLQDNTKGNVLVHKVHSSFVIESDADDVDEPAEQDMDDTDGSDDVATSSTTSFVDLT